MEFVDSRPAGGHRHKWLAWLGLQEPPPQPDSWVPVARAFRVNDQTGSSGVATLFVAALDEAGIEARQRVYGIDATKPTSAGIGSGGLKTRIAVLVHHRDLERALKIAAAFERDLERDRRRREAALGNEGEAIEPRRPSPGRHPG